MSTAAPIFSELEHYRSLDFFARQVVEGFVTGLHKSPFHGFSVEFAEHRQYNAGESTRNIDWKLYARTDRLYVKNYEEETNLRCQVIIDQSNSMLFPLEGHGDLHHPNKFTFSIYGAALLVELLARQRDAFGLTLLSDGIDMQTECRSNSQHRRYIMGLLEEALARPLDERRRTTQTTSLAESLHLTAERLHRRSLVVIFTDALVGNDEEVAIFDALRHLRHCKHEVLLFHTLDKNLELDFDYGNRPTEFIDLETGRRLKVQPASVAESYRNATTLHTEQLKEQAIQNHIDYQAVDVGQGFDNVMLPFLLKRGRHH
ncbi:MAG: DUF58 domain-containing protein [Bacteroidales bacterium]|nr:DUF58 domain-containing protein [Bacteroidales bacterium]